MRGTAGQQGLGRGRKGKEGEGRDRRGREGRDRRGREGRDRKGKEGEGRGRKGKEGVGRSRKGCQRPMARKQVQRLLTRLRNPSRASLSSVASADINSSAME